jgi:hypothetical protein
VPRLLLQWWLLSLLLSMRTALCVPTSPSIRGTRNSSCSYWPASMRQDSHRKHSSHGVHYSGAPGAALHAGSQTKCGESQPPGTPPLSSASSNKCELGEHSELCNAYCKQVVPSQHCASHFYFIKLVKTDTSALHSQLACFQAMRASHSMLRRVHQVACLYRINDGALSRTQHVCTKHLVFSCSAGTATNGLHVPAFRCPCTNCFIPHHQRLRFTESAVTSDEVLRYSGPEARQGVHFTV